MIKHLNNIKNIDVLIDGPFILKEKSLDIKFRGSRNQRVIDVKRSLAGNKTEILKGYNEDTKKKEQKVHVFI